MKAPVVFLVAAGLALSAVLCLRAQPGGGPAGGPPPPRVAPSPPHSPEPPRPTPVAAVEQPATPVATEATPPAPELSPEKQRRAEVARWVDARGYPPWIAEYVDKYEAVGIALAVGVVLARPLIFVAVLLLVGLALPLLLRAAMVARAGSPTGQAAALTPRQVALAALIGWCVAFIIASELIGLTWFGAVMAGVGNLLGGIARLLGSILAAVMWVGVVALIAYAASVPSREFVLSLLGFYYLRHHPKRPGPDDLFDLGEGRRGRVESVDLFQTTFSVDGGATQTRPNAWLMREHFKWTVPSGAAEAGTG